MKNEIMAKVLRALYIIVLIFTIALIIVMHTVPDPALAVFRIPKQLREVCPSLGFGWPKSLQVYHIFLLSFFTVTILNGASLFRLHIPKWRSICQVSSVLGLLLILSIFLIFKLPFGLKNNCDPNHLQTSLIYSSFLFAFFIVDFLTLVVVRKAKNYFYLEEERK